MNKIINKTAWFANGIANRVNAKKTEQRWREDDKRQMQFVDLPELSEAEYEELKQTWPFLNFKKNDVYWARLYKKEYGFNPYFISSVNQSYQLRAKINPRSQVCSLENKALVDIYFPEIPFPEVYVRRINNSFYDQEMNRISFEEATTILQQMGSFIIKPSLGTMCGKGVKKYVIEEGKVASREWFSEVFEGATSNFIAQEVLVQHPDISRLNPTSLNCCRITSIYINGIYTYGAMLKIGKKGAHIDNWNSGYLVGINSDGSVKEKGWDDKLSPVYQTDNGIVFDSIQYPCFQDLLQSIERYHKKYFPQCGIVGWDVIIDQQNNPKVIEANLAIPGIPAEQLCSGPFFKMVHDELIKVFQ